MGGIDRLDYDYVLIGTGFPFRAPERLPAYLEQLDAVPRRTAGVRRAGSAAIDLCHVATGLFDGFWELVLAPWDVAAGMLIIRESGGRPRHSTASPTSSALAQSGPGTPRSTARSAKCWAPCRETVSIR